jgi:hypothetical protein
LHVLRRSLMPMLLLLLVSASPLRAQDPGAEVRRLLAEADAATWFALNDQGDLATFDLGLDRLAAAESLLALLPQGPEREDLQRQAEALALDLRWQREVAHDKLAAVFPLIRFYKTSLLFDPQALGSHELFDDPRDRAAEQALRGIMALPLAGLPQRPQLDVVFAERPPDRELESNALTLLNQSRAYFVHNGREVAAALGDAALAERVGDGELSPETAARLMAAFGSERLLHLVLQRQPAFDGAWFFVAEARVFGEEAGRVLDQAPVRVMGFGRDRTQLLWPLAFVHLALWAAAVAAHQVLRGGRFDASDLVMPSFGFLIGRVTPWLLLPALSQVRPDDGHFAPAGFWWPALAGALLLFVPVAALRLLGRRLPVIGAYLSWERGLESLALAVACGLAAWLAVPHFALREAAGVPSFLLALPALLATAWLVARLVKGEVGEAWMAPLAALALGLAIAKAEAAWTAAAMALALAGLLMRPRAGTAAARQEPGRPAAPYLPFGVLPRLLQAADPLARRQVVWLALTGPAGSGKSRHAQALVEALRRTTEDRPFLLLDGACQRLPDGGAVPFAPFQRCLQQHLRVRLQSSAAPAGETALYDLLLGPLAPLFSGSGSLMASERDLYAFVVRALRQQSARARVVLLVEDTQWLDEASEGLLGHLQGEMPAGSAGELLVLLVGRREGEGDALGKLLPGAVQVTLQPLSLEEQESLLHQGRGLSPAVSAWIMDWLGAPRGQAVWPGTLAEVVEQLERAGVLRPGPLGLEFGTGFDPARPPIAESALAEVRGWLQRLPQTRDTLSIAACLGRQFFAELVAAALRQSRKDVIKDLEVLEREAGLVRDVLEVDDLYEFRSQRILDALREALAIRLAGPEATDVPQGVRELHALCAAALAKRGGENLAELLAAATHWYGAGRRHAGEAVTWNLRAAVRLARLLRFAEAGTFLAQAAATATLCGREAEVERLRLWLAAERSHVTGVGARAAAAAGLGALGDDPAREPALALATARACYEAGRDGGPSLLDEAERLALAVAEGGAATALQRAQGLHLAGLALRFRAERRADCVARLEQAMALAADAGSEGEALLAQIANSLALVRGADNPAEAEGLFKRSIELKRQQAIPDRPGLARSYGGLGLLLLQGGDPARLPEAEDYLRQDLALAEEIGDRAGLSKVRLWLAEARLLRGDATGAAALLAEVVAQDQSPADRISAEAGLLAVAAAAGDRGAYLARAEALALLLGDQPVPAESRASLRRALTWPEMADAPAVVALEARLEASR